MNINSFEASLSSKKLQKQLLIFAGPDEFLKERAICKLIAAFVPSEDVDDNVQRLVCSARNKDVILSEIYSFAYNESPRVFILTLPESIPAKTRKIFFHEIASNGLPVNTFLVISTVETRVANELDKIIGKLGEKIDFWTPFENKIPSWVEKEAMGMGVKITSGAINLLLEKTGNELRLLWQELQKLAITSKTKKITESSVKKYVAYSKNETVFDLLEYLGTRKANSLMRSVESLINKNESPQKIWFMVVKQIRDYREFHDLLLDRPDIMIPVADNLKSLLKIYGKSDFKANQERKRIQGNLSRLSDEMPLYISKRLGLKQRFRQNKMALALNYSRNELVNLWPDMIKMDSDFKSGAIDLCGMLQRFLLSVVT